MCVSLSTCHCTLAQPCSWVIISNTWERGCWYDGWHGWVRWQMLSFYLTPTSPELFCTFHYTPPALFTTILTIGRIWQKNTTQPTLTWEQHSTHWPHCHSWAETYPLYYCWESGSGFPSYQPGLSWSHWPGVPGIRLMYNVRWYQVWSYKTISES